MEVGDNVRLVRQYGEQTVVLPAIVLATENHVRLRHVEGTEDWEKVPPEDTGHERVLDLTEAPTPLPGTVHVVYFALGGPAARVELNAPTDKDEGYGLWVEAL